ncbi:MAG: hypothetical protein WAK18_09490 [Nocardioidaceae bacterium]
MYPQHTGSILLDIAHAQRRELVRDAENRRRVRSSISTQAPVGTAHPRRPRWWGFARSHHAA